MKFATDDNWTVINALRVAASGYRENAQLCQVGSHTPGAEIFLFVAEKFEAQAKDCERIAVELEQDAEG